ncbi:hypothetical protein NC652_008016 [Populus alba x Populus x berolinensis]|nr:hypothetical protein NC652_008016 [Populus alba x Populus x berolinensis]
MIELLQPKEIVEKLRTRWVHLAGLWIQNNKEASGPFLSIWHIIISYE